MKQRVNMDTSLAPRAIDERAETAETRVCGSVSGFASNDKSASISGSKKFENSSPSEIDKPHMRRERRERENTRVKSTKVFAALFQDVTRG